MHPQEVPTAIDEVTERIGHVFVIGTEFQPPDIESIHAKFVDCIEYVNGRLLRCDELLSRGLRGEAIQESEQSPPLLDLVTGLDIPEWDAWAGYVCQRGLAPQPDLHSQIAGEINDAYTQQQPLLKLLELHRVSALARSPLSRRIQILRRIVEEDANNSVWRRDLREFELARIEQINSLSLQPDIMSDATAVRELNNELDDPRWSVPIQAELKQRVGARHVGLQSSAARHQLEQIAREIESAYAATDLGRCLQARDRWNQFAGIASLSTSDPLSRRAEPALHWMDEQLAGRQRAHDAQLATNKFESLLENPDSRRHELENHYSAMKRQGFAISDHVNARHVERIAEFDRAEKRSMLLRIGSISLGIVFVATVIFFGARSVTQSYRTEKARRTIERLVESGDIKAADDLRRNFDSAIANSPNLTEVITRLDRSIDKEKGRLSSLRDVINECENKISKATLLVEERPPDVETANIAMDDAQAVTLELSLGIDRHAKNVPELERLRCGEIRSAVERINEVCQPLLDKSFEDEIDRLRSDGEALLLSEEAANEDRLRKLKALFETIKSVPETHKHVSDDKFLSRKEELEGVGADVEREIEDLAHQLRVHEHLKSIKDAVAEGDIDAYGGALRDYVESLPDDVMNKDFVAVWEKELRFIDDIQTWNEAIDRKPAARKLLEELGDSFFYQNQLESIRKYFSRESEERRQSSIEAINKYFDRWWFKMDSFTHKKGQTVRERYIRPNQKPDGPNFVFYEYGNALNERQWTEKVVKKVEIVRRKNQNLFGPAPHTLFAARARAQLAAGEYEIVICNLLTDLHQNRTTPKMDSIVRAHSIQVILREGMKGSDIINRKMKAVEDAAETRVSFDEKNWIDNDGRVMAKEVVRKLNTLLPNATKDVTDEFGLLVKPRLKKKVWVGVLLQSGNTWVVAPRKGDWKSHDFKLEVVDVEATPIQMTSIGEVKEGRDAIDGSKTNLLRYGRPVYASQND